MPELEKQMASVILKYQNEKARVFSHSITVGCDGRVYVAERDVNCGKVEYLPLIVKDGKLYVEEVKHEA